MLFYVVITLVAGTVSGLNVRCNNPHTANCENGAKLESYFREGETCVGSPACPGEGYATKEDCQKACFPGGGDHSTNVDSSCFGQPPTSCETGAEVTYYDSGSRTCKVLQHGCPSSENAFDSEIECQVACGVSME
uniref:Thrombin inhibitor savignin n=1 Tax=Ornithodoros kalahariensis TaxID=1580572 RepID=KUNI_ORNKA|nr:RecName: Full=Thrombin inhibitor savignin; Flags: Precursor [Ornithodoros kalahariensis]AAL37210.1 savignin [Ornithodoros kalahariensis]